jgi:MFS family permease
LRNTNCAGVSNLLTSVVEVYALGTISLAIVYLFLTLFSIAGPFVVDYLSPKRAITFGIAPYVLYLICCVVAIAQPEEEILAWILLCFGSAAVGTSAAFLWVGQGVYLARSAELYAIANGEERGSSLGHFNGIFFGIFSLNQIFGNLTSSLLLDQASVSTTVVFLIFFGVAVVGFFYSFRLAKLPLKATTDLLDKRVSLRESAANMMALWSDQRLQLLIPLFMLSGTTASFLSGDFTGSFFFLQ